MMLIKLFQKCRCGAEFRSKKTKRCRASFPQEIKKPDLAIYSQSELFMNGEMPTWDSPDISTNSLGSLDLLQETRVTFRNISSQAPATGVAVHYSVSPFGIGFEPTYKSSQNLNLSPSEEKILSFPNDQDILNGEQNIGVHIKIEHPRDSQLLNNNGSQVITLKRSSDVGRSFQLDVPVFNKSSTNTRYSFQIYSTALRASLNAQSSDLGPNELINKILNIEVPTSLRGTASDTILEKITLVATERGNLIGGVTLLLQIDN